jgi:hypothetical protein
MEVLAPMTDGEILLDAMGVSPSPPATLYHYTSAQAFLSIARTNRIWASHVGFLNDTSEAEWMWDTALRRLRFRADSANSEEDKTSILGVIDLIQRRSPCSDFVASFTENGDDLSQWRAYCHNSPGLSIGFSSAALQTQWIRDPQGGDSFFVGSGLKRVIYLSEDDPSDFDRHLDVVLNQLAPLLREKGGFQGPMTREQATAGWLASAASRYKHASFRGEHEWRLIMQKPHKPMPGQRFRPGMSSLIPYVEVELNRDYKSERPAKQVIERIIVGPSPDPELSVQAVKAFVTSIDQPEIDVRPSSIPYKNW